MPLPVLRWPPQRIDYAKTKSFATLRREDPNFVPPSSIHANSLSQAQQNGKRPRDGAYADGEPSAKREKADESDEEMEIEDDDDSAPQSKPLRTSPHALKPHILHNMSSKSDKSNYHASGHIYTRSPPAMYKFA
jgi:U2 small nuclear ribonucleoprotein B''